MPRALISVHDKVGLVEFGRSLIALGWDIVASGGTERALVDANVPVTPVEQVTGVAEMLGGRVKTLHPAIHAGILARDRDEDYRDLEANGYGPISMVVCNLYPFQETVAQPNIAMQDAIEQIDIGGVTLLRAAAKNFFRVTAVCDPFDYAAVLAVIQAEGEVPLAVRQRLAVKAFAHTRDYDTAIHAFLAGDPKPDAETTLPDQISFGGKKVQAMRYGENPHQQAAYYSRKSGTSVLGGEQLAGKELSYNNILDLDAAWRTVSSFNEPTVVIVKHLTPTGVATDENLAEAYRAALASDPVSAFGGIIALNRAVDVNFVEALESIFLEAIAAPDFTPEAEALLIARRKNCRLVKITQPYDGSEIEVRSVHRGLLIQQVDMGDPEDSVFRVVTNKQPSMEELNTLKFAWNVVQHVKSNAIVLAQPNKTVGVGGGLPSRVDAVEIAIKKAANATNGAVMASDAFFPFADGIEAAIKAGVVAVIQPGGSIRDNEVIQAANDAGITMIFTGTRHFRH